MIKKIYARAFTVLSRKPFKLWGLSLLGAFFMAAAGILAGPIPGLSIALCMLLSVGMTMVFLHGYLGEDVKTVNLFDCFKDWKTIKRVLCGMAYTGLWVVLWSLIPIVGPVFGAIRCYEYALTPYILVMEPDVPITEAYKVSRERMDGFKAKMFWADWLWLIICWAAVLVLGLLAQIPAVGVIFGIAMVLAIAVIALFGNLFKGLVDAAFYVEIQKQNGEGPQFDDSMNEPPVKETPAPAAAPSGSVRYCPNCGAPNVAGGKFCCACGFRFEAAVEPEAPAAAEEPATGEPEDQAEDEAAEVSESEAPTEEENNSDI